MRVFLLSDVASLGRKGSVVEVSSGFAKNFLIPFNKASFYSGAGVNNQIIPQSESNTRVKTEFLKVVKKKLLDLTVFFKRKNKGSGFIYGSIKKKDILSELRRLGFLNSIKFASPGIKLVSFGRHSVFVFLGMGVTASFSVCIVDSSLNEK